MNWLDRSGIKNNPENGGDEAAPQNAKATPVIEDERGIPAINERSFKSRAMPLTLAALALTVAGLVWLIPSPKAPPNKLAGDPKATINERFDEGAVGALLAPSKPAAPGANEPASGKNAEPIKVIPAPQGAAPGGGSAGAKRELTPFEMRQISHITIGTRAETPNNNQAAARDPSERARLHNPPPPVTSAPVSLASPASIASSTLPGKDDAGSKPNAFAESLTPTKLKGVSASKLADRTFTIAQGAMVHCALDTAISSSQPGMTKCTTTRHIYGDDGKVILLDKGTELTGQYQSGLRQGQARLFVLWVRAKTPAGVIIDLASPATDQLGRSGLDGEIDKHFFERFGSALLLSIVDDVAGVIAARAQSNDGSGNTVLYPSNTASTSKDAAAIAVENSVRIPPTLNKNQGELVSVFVARDLDFRTVYSIKVANDR